MTSPEGHSAYDETRSWTGPVLFIPDVPILFASTLGVYIEIYLFIKGLHGVHKPEYLNGHRVGNLST